MSLSIAGGFGLGDPFQPRPLGSYIPSLFGREHPPRPAPPRPVPCPGAPSSGRAAPRRAAAAGVEVSGVGWRREHPSRLGGAEGCLPPSCSLSRLAAGRCIPRHCFPPAMSLRWRQGLFLLGLSVFGISKLVEVNRRLCSGYGQVRSCSAGRSRAEGWRWSWHCPRQALCDPPHLVPDQRSPHQQQVWVCLNCCENFLTAGNSNSKKLLGKQSHHQHHLRSKLSLPL